MRKLTVDDIADLRAYERERDEFRSHVIALKRRRRIPLGDLLTITFENTDTMRFQVQEMARAEKMLTDAAIEHEVATYNELIPEPGELSGTLFVELISDELLREWLPRLVGIQRAIAFVVDGERSPAIPEVARSKRSICWVVVASSNTSELAKCVISTMSRSMPGIARRRACTSRTRSGAKPRRCMPVSILSQTRSGRVSVSAASHSTCAS